ncbi:MAG: oligoendopeptidase F [Clostridiales bacterium]|nr:oligoendopeptidase F [Clostridiales bacterium]
MQGAQTGGIPERKDVPETDKWDLASMYADEADWDADLQKAKDLAEEFAAYQGKLKEGGSGLLLEALQKRDAIWLPLEKAYVYARQKKDEDNRVSRYQALCDQVHSVMAQVSAKTAFFTPEVLSIDPEVLQGYVQKGEVGIYGHLIDELLREKEHVLSKEEEGILARMSELTSATNDIFSMINNADMNFGTVTDEDGKETELTHGRYISFMESPKREVRKEAFEKLYAAYTAQKNTLATVYHYNTKTDAVNASLRKYSSARAASMSGDNVPEDVYDSLVEAVNRHLPALHRYLALRKKVLGVDDLHMYDVYVPLTEPPVKEISFADAKEMLKTSLAPLGEKYIADAAAGMEDGWIDVYENKGKTSGAYSFGSYDSKPYVLLNYDGKLKDVFTLVHEMGHSMNSLYTREAQPYIYGGHSIFTAEVASTVNENLLMNYLLEKEQDPEMQKYLLNLYLEEFRSTVYRQTMFAEFEKASHELVERGETLTAEVLCQIYGDLNRKYFGEGVVSDEQIAMEWARIPHFYNAFYVYKYATGYSAASALAQGILKGGDKEREAYLEFLASGECDYPLELLKRAGVDMSKPEPVEKALELFEELLGKLEALL